MTTPSTEAQAIVLRALPYGEADVIVHLLVRGHGRTGAFARGARKSMKRFGGGLEPFCLLDVELQTRPGRDLADLKASRPAEGFPGIRGDLHRMAHAGYATELVRELSRDREPNDGLFDLLLEMFNRLEANQARSLRLRAFELEALGRAGLSPVLDGCARCGDEAAVWFDSEEGGVSCERCRRTGAMALGAAGLRLLRVLQSGGMTAGEADETSLPIESCRLALRSFIMRQVRHDLGSIDFLRNVGAPL